MVPIKLCRADAVVLFDWLQTVDLDQVPITHPAEKQALADLFTRLEQETDIPGVTQAEIVTARLMWPVTWVGDAGQGDRYVRGT